MKNRESKQKFFYINVTLFGVLLCVVGGLFLIPALVVQVVPITPDNFHFTINGVTQPYSLENVRMFRLIFLLVFGFVGMIPIVIGGIVIIWNKMKRRQQQRLKEEGRALRAKVNQLTSSSIRLYNGYGMRLMCSYKNEAGETYLFKSQLLRIDPTPFLNEGQVTVYCDRENSSNYFVDIDGSVEKVYEL
ncbi:hypothetical protein DOK67_0001994 [Enterococcus sp. DIV0212c]|uniref:hypothetical protein n=1 Tax=Enterococcus sp. DIV0212c TaxID=2230867 RepID=UPI001A9B1F5A|nr:hypothetical protein [Enterococcus sp. DIV0212c]MBO1355364.1 hypothetical protein [Enterococcus sp. DIV0212c]